MKVFLAITTIIAVSSGAPRYLVIPIEDVDFGDSNMAQRFPIYRMPALARQARAAQQEEDSFQIAPQLQQRQYEPETSASNSYSAPAAPAGPDHVDYGAYTGGYGAFGWYTDHPVLLAGH
eukprot:TRINITY_DN902_c0_g1_i2.p2 TRINITY_DN902_c0_g1~~TRINITY_DN902_c0_g1_i2.p2  ORF type:complete len:120 (-),score=32.11 TRINITY_DN902_c0_g1_i2:54-413(-)